MFASYLRLLSALHRAWLWLQTHLFLVQTLISITAALQQELIIPRSPSPDLVMSPVNSRNANDTNNSQSRDERIANLKVCVRQEL